MLIQYIFNNDKYNTILRIFLAYTVLVYIVRIVVESTIKVRRQQKHAGRKHITNGSFKDKRI